jgi:hypothetical protein
MSCCKCLSSLWSSPGSKPLVNILCKYLKNKHVQQVFGELLFDKNSALLNIKLAIIKQVSDKIVKKAEKTLP